MFIEDLHGQVNSWKTLGRTRGRVGRMDLQEQVKKLEKAVKDARDRGYKALKGEKVRHERRE